MTDAPQPDDRIALSGYQIVYPNGSTEQIEGLAAYELQAALAEKSCKLGISTDSASVGKPLLLVGKTTATEGTMPTDNAYSVSVDANGTVQIAAGSYYGYRAAIEYLVSNLKNGSIPDDLNYTADASVLLMSAPSGALRVMYYNLYGYNDTDGKKGGPISLRHAMQLEMIASYSPDVICFQEYVSDSHNILTEKLKALGYTYTELNCGFSAKIVNDSVDEVNDTPIFYKANKLTPVKAGYLCYSASSASTTQNCNNANTKSLSWAVFQDASENQVAIVNTHLMYNENGVNHDPARQANVVELLAQITTIKQQYANVPIILGGDLNSNNTSAAFNDILSGGFVWMQTVQNVNADTLGYKNYATYSFDAHLYTNCPAPDATGYGIDHVFYSGNIGVINYRTLTDRNSCLASDHCPKLVDLALN